MYAAVEQVVCEIFHVTPEQVRDINPHNLRDTRDARHFVWYVMHEVLGYRSLAIAEEYGVTKRNINHFVSLIDSGVHNHPFYARHYRTILNKLKESNII